jgi:hypothetical protein
MEDWEFVGVFQNIWLDKAIEWPGVGILPISDPRLPKLLNSNLAAFKLTNGFSDQYGRQVRVAPIVIERNAFRDGRFLPALIDFRNTIAISAVANGWADTLVSTSTMSRPLYGLRRASCTVD